MLPPPLETDEEKCCLIALVDKNVAMSKEQAKKQLIEHNLRLVVYLAKKFENTGVCVEDLISIGTIGLIKGINTFNPEKKIKLATYASRCIENEILMYLRRNNRVKLEVSFDEPLNTDWDGNELLLSDILGTDEDVIYKDLETEVEISLLKKAMLSLNERERQIIELRFGVNRVENKELTQKEVADILGISQSSLGRIMAQENLPSLITLEKICTALGVTLSQFFQEGNSENLTEKQKEVLRIWNNLSTNEQETVMSMLRGLRK